MTQGQRVTVVTGGSRGIGAAVAVRLAREGHHVAIGYERSHDAAEQVAREVRAEGVRALPVQLDTSVEADVDRLFETVADRLGPVTGLVNNAGVTGPLGRFTETPTDVMRRVLDVNVLGTLLCSRRALLALSGEDGGQGGCGVNIA
jgi:NAD(P)-dependent dehydrogenase (short-subunit alcohol dehydrogenase family)